MKSIYERIHEYQLKGINAMLVTVVSKQGEGPVEVGKKMLVSETGEAFGTVGGGALEYYAREKVKTLLNTQSHYHERYVLNEDKVIPNATTLPMVCGGVVTLFYEYIGSGKPIYIFGAGHVSQALVTILKTLPFHITVIDERTPVIEAFKGADVLVNQGFAPYIKAHGLRPKSMVVVCTPSHKHDYHVINTILEKNIDVDYIGMLCSKEKIKDYLEKTYKTFGKDVNLNHFYSPIGLDLGGGSPEEIAISITAELLAILHDKKGHKHMRNTHEHNHRYWHD